MTMILVAIIFGITQALLARTIDSWWKVNANADAQQQLYKAQAFLERDLANAAFETETGRETFGIDKTSSLTELNSLSGSDSDVLWFLSAVDPLSGNFQRHPTTGEPLWQRNIIYYAVTPQNVSSFGYSASGTNVGGYESACPYKVLIRKEVDAYDPTLPGDPSTIEPLIDDLTGFIDRPDGYDTSTMSKHGGSVRPISGNIITFRATQDNQLGGITIDLRATAIDRAKREAGGIGTRDLASNPATQQLQITIFPPNRQGDDSTTPP